MSFQHRDAYYYFGSGGVSITLFETILHFKPLFDSPLKAAFQRLNIQHCSIRSMFHFVAIPFYFEDSNESASFAANYTCTASAFLCKVFAFQKNNTTGKSFMHFS